MNEADFIAESIASELRALDVILQRHDPHADEDLVAASVDRLDMRAWGEITDARLDSAVWLWLEEICVGHKRYREIGGEGRRLVITRSCNGPHVEISRDTDDGTAITIDAYDGRDHAHRRVHESALADALDQYAFGGPE